MHEIDRVDAAGLGGEELLPARARAAGAGPIPIDESGRPRNLWPAAIFQHLIEAHSELDRYSRSREQMEEMGWRPYCVDEGTPPFDRLWRPADLSAD